jgi:hypothetical protein
MGNSQTHPPPVVLPRGEDEASAIAFPLLAGEGINGVGERIWLLLTA